jgi:ubiquinone/menaquinone biosynthesis C-methylase UbiE
MDEGRVGRADEVWRSAEVSRKFLEGIRGALPLAGEHVDVMLRMVEAAAGEMGRGVKRVVDLGCGDGVLTEPVLERHGEAAATVVDFSAEMLGAAKQRLKRFGSRVKVVQADLADVKWVEALGASGEQVDVVVSGFAIHHQPDEVKRRIYEQVFEMLGAGGVFVHLEHVSSATAWGQKLFDERMIDAFFAYHQTKRADCTREEIEKWYRGREDHAANILLPVEVQCGWLREIGFEDVDCFFKLFEFAIFGGRRGGR